MNTIIIGFTSFLVILPLMSAKELQTAKSEESLELNKVNKTTNLSRHRRNVAQLAFLVDTFTPFRSGQLLKHGYWCGLGGDRRKDGSVWDQCDICCRAHDHCYDDLLKGSIELRGENVVYTVNQVLSNFEYNGKSIHLDLPSSKTRCNPYLDTYQVTNIGGNPHCVDVGRFCSKSACKCDVDFAYCLRQARCSIH